MVLGAQVAQLPQWGRLAVMVVPLPASSQSSTAAPLPAGDPAGLATPTTDERLPFPITWQRAALFFVASLAIGALSIPHLDPPLSFLAWSPPAGLLLGALLLLGVRYALLLIVLGLAAQTALFGWPVQNTVLISGLLLALVYLAMAVVWRFGLQKPARLERLSDLTQLLVLTAVGSWIGGMLYLSFMAYVGLVPLGRFWLNVTEFWVNDLVRILVVLPLLLVHMQPQNLQTRWQLKSEPVIQAGAMLFVFWIIFGLDITDEFKFFYLLFLPLTWIAMRHGVHGATLALLGLNLALNAVLIWMGHDTNTVLEFKMLMLGLAVTGLFLGMVVSERRQAELRMAEQDAELNSALRLAAAGEMAQAMAHELNQPLAAIRSYADVARLMMQDPKQHYTVLSETLDKISNESARAARVVKRLREFFRSGVLRREALSFRSLLDEALEPLRKRAERDGIRLTVRGDPGGLHVFVDRVQIATVLHNLVGNAMDALHKAPTGAWREIEINARLEANATWVRICVTDTGPGVSSDMAATLFEPFATNKPEGMGLGLVISRTLIESHGGRLWLERALPARFCFTIPIHEHPA